VEAVGTQAAPTSPALEGLEALQERIQREMVRKG
jgi:hypothetical protein